VSGKTNHSRRSRREEAQIENAKNSQRLVTSAATIREDVTPYRVAGSAGVPPAGSGGVPAASSVTPGADARSTRRRDACATIPRSALGTPRFVDLFCGIGGFRIAFQNAGCECVFSSDWNKYAQQTYAANFGETPHGDIHSVAVADIPAHDILCAGFPCQPFSIAGVSKKLSLGKAHGFDDKEQGNLFFSLAEIIECHQPAAFVLENVKNLKSHDQGRTFQIIYNTLTDALGYHLHTAVIDAQSVVPQHRERIFLVGFKERRAFEFPQFPAQGPKLESILETDVPDKYTLTDHLWN
jgi:DNA (cytosine-5)-methyltransferase 1